MIIFLNNMSWAFWVLIVSLGLIFGSFLNLVIYRLPIMLDNAGKSQAKSSAFNLAFPPSHCPKCQHKISIWCNIPVVSFLLLRGKCHHCKASISIRYLLVEVLSCLASIAVAWQWGITLQTIFLLPLTWALIALAFIDIKDLILPDIITIPCLWLGLIASLFNLFVTAKEAILGAIFGYIFLWGAARIFKIIRKIEGMGYGDFKLLAVFGAWCGWRALPSIILLASVLCIVIGGLVLLWKKRAFNCPVPFGPFIVLSGWVALMFDFGEYIWRNYF
jgi:leader peptidase (prepilin peptidase) / N-methyltransferase